MSLWCRLFPRWPGCQPPEPPPPDPGPEPPQGEMAAQVMEEANRIRSELGLAEFSLHECLANQAQEHTENMADSGRLSHNGFSARLRNCTVGVGAENVAAGYPTAESVVNGWMTSPGHRANLLKGSYRQAGVGYVADGRGYDHWYTMIYTT